VLSAIVAAPHRKLQNVATCQSWRWPIAPSCRLNSLVQYNVADESCAQHHIHPLCCIGVVMGTQVHPTASNSEHIKGPHAHSIIFVSRDPGISLSCGLDGCRRSFTSLFLFLVGLVEFFFTTNKLVAIVASMVLVVGLFGMIITILACVDRDCPYHTLMSGAWWSQRERLWYT
jgi:hypothetical protein